MDPQSSTDLALQRLAADIPRLSGRVSREIRSEIAGYDPVPIAEHDRDVCRQIEDIVLGLQYRRPPGPEQIELAREIGRRRSTEDVPLTDVIEAYHIAFREIWNGLLEQSQEVESAGGGVIDHVGLLWNWIHRLSAAVADAHSEHSRGNEAARATLRQQLVDAIANGLTGDEQEVIAEQLGYEVAENFLVVCTEPDSSDGINQTNRMLASSNGVGHCCNYADRLVIVSQGIDLELLRKLGQRRSPATHLGIGIPRRGLMGATLSLQDATDALARARSGHAEVSFRQEWLGSVVAANRDRLAPILSTGAAAGDRHSALADTVRAYAANGFSISACARELNIHPNTAKYRLDRWAVLTSWRIDSFDGLVNSICALYLCAPDPVP